MSSQFMGKQLIIQVEELRTIESLPKVQRGEMLPATRAFRSFETELKHEDRGADPEHGRSLFGLMETGSWNELG